MSQLTDFRKAKDQYFATSHDSPLTDEQKRQFSSLAYYDESAELSFQLPAEEFPDKETIEMQTSTGGAAAYRRWGKVSFEVDGEAAELTLYQDSHGHGDEFFVPFMDATRGDETYTSGRYIEAHPIAGGKVLVDFNNAYNPYCAYNERWSCPLTPFENRLQVPIRAGEKSFK